MGYMRSYQGDYMRSYVGDPGFFGGIFGKIAKIGKGALAGALGAAGIGKRPPAQGIPGPPGLVGGRIPIGPGTRTPVRFRPGKLLPGGEPAFDIPGQPCPSNYHLAKDGSGRLVRNRRMNVANVKALRRATRRQKGFVKLAKRSLPPGYRITTSRARK